MGWRLAVWAASCRIPRTQGEPCLVMWPWRTLRSELRTWGVSPAQAHSLRAVGKRAMSPISATKVMAVSLPTPGRAVSAWTRGSGLASPAISRSSRTIGVARASSSPQQSWMIARGSAAGQGRPARLAQNRSTGSGLPGRHGRPAPHAPGSCRRSTAAPGWPGGAAGPADPGPAGVRSKPRAADQPAAAGPGWPHPPCRSSAGPRRSPYSGWDGPGAAPAPTPRADRPATPAVGGLEGHRGTWRQRAKDRHQLGRVVGQVAVVLGDAGGIHDGDLGALAMHVHTDVHSHQGLLPRARLVPEA